MSLFGVQVKLKVKNTEIIQLEPLPIKYHGPKNKDYILVSIYIGIFNENPKMNRISAKI